jgi:hypothetical protein
MVTVAMLQTLAVMKITRLTIDVNHKKIEAGKTSYDVRY